MSLLGWIGFGIVLFLALSATLITVACCMRSSQISRKEEYYELILEVANKYPGETRHETALRYIRERENQEQRVAMSAEKE